MRPRTGTPAEGARRHLLLAGRAAERAAEERQQAGWCADPELLATHLLAARRLDDLAAEHRCAFEFLTRACAER